MSTSAQPAPGSPYHRGDVPERVIAAARELLDEMPARDISVRQLARSASVSHAAPYRHFGDRHGFLVALGAHCFAEFVDAQRSAYEHAVPGERLVGVGRAYVDYAIASPFAFDLIFDPDLSPSGQIPDEFEPMVIDHGELLERALLDAVEAAALIPSGSLEDLGAAMWSAAHGLAALVTANRISAERVPGILTTLLTS